MGHERRSSHAGGRLSIQEAPNCIKRVGARAIGCFSIFNERLLSPSAGGILGDLFFTPGARLLDVLFEGLTGAWAVITITQLSVRFLLN